jgi:hypothetical protein
MTDRDHFAAAAQDAAEPSPASAGYHGDGMAARLRSWRDERGYPTPGEMLDDAADEIERLRLTDPERDAIRMAQGMFLVEHDLCLADERAGKTPLMPSSYWQGLVDVMHGLRERAG